MLSQNEFINALFKNELSEFVNIMEFEYQKYYNKYTDKINNIETFMNKYVKNNIPDYNGFIEYLYSLHKEVHDGNSISIEYNLLFSSDDYVPPFDLFYIDYIVYHKLYTFFEHYKSKSINMEDSLWIKLLLGITNIQPNLLFNVRIYNAMENSKLNQDICTFSGDYKSLFYKNFNNENHDDAIRCLEHREDLDKGEYEYLNALVCFKEEKFEKALEFIDKIDHTCIDYNSSIFLKMQIYAITNTEKLFEMLNENKDKLAKDEIDCLILENILCLEIDDLKKEKYENVYKLWIENKDSNVSELSTENMDLLFIEYFDIVFEIYDKITLLNISLEAIPNDKKIIDNFKFILELLKIDRFNFIVNKDNIKNKKFELMIKELINYYDRYSNNIKILEQIAKFLYKYQYIDYYCDFIEKHLTLFKNESLKDPHYLNYIYEAYLEEKIRNKVNNSIEEIYNSFYGENETLESKLKVEKLTNEGVIAYRAAELYFNLSKKIDYGWKDAGMLSLSYFRIIELELNKKILLKVVNNKYPLKSIYYEYLNRNDISEIEKDKYKRKWHFLFEVKDDNNYMLGQIYKFFDNLSNINNINDKLAKLLYDKTKGIILESSLNSNFFKNMISEEIRNKYRNPPAHTKYLKYETAKECREYVINQLNQLFEVLI